MTSKQSVDRQCPICHGHDFVDFNGRPAVRCITCGSFERTRLMALILRELTSDWSGRSVIHFAPEVGLASWLASMSNGNYRCFDINPRNYKVPNIEVEQLDLCSQADLMQLKSRDGFDLIVHNHVLEHVPCNYASVIQRLNDLLSPGGLHVFSVPVIGSYFREDRNPELTAQDRTELFGQDDHIRAFGKADVREDFAMVFGTDVHFSSIVNLTSVQLTRAGVPSEVLSDISSHTTYVYRKP